ncbi:MAG TPA: amidohydrolase [Gammaproteobacteria bacterium]|jgi:predicted amidohydrolase YtcJ|nr:amidohydrolase [Gammaproteobacteria bacterium]|tara:strand:+ start:775 stop:2505 length:1731 start_codon:yes stop_codon:yes gene_type:complete
MYKIIFIALSLMTLNACELSDKAPRADVVFTGGAVYRVTDTDPWATAVAITEKRITYVGDDVGAASSIGPNTRVVELDGKMLMPGFQDAHVHPVDSGMTFNQCAVFDLPQLQDLLDAIRACVDERPNAEWIVGAGWYVSTFAPTGRPPKELLDAIAPDTPITLLSNAAHTVWANSAAIKRAGITAETEDPEGGRIDRNPLTGEPSGSFQESAMPLIQSFEPAITLKERIDGLAYAQRLFHSFGITGVHDSYVEVSRETAYTNMEAYTAFADKGKLKMHVVAAMLYDPTLPLKPQIELFKTLRKMADRNHVKATAVKILVDGVATSYSAAMLKPYADRKDEGITGTPLIPRADLIDLVSRLDALGFQIHFHSIGDAATHYSLDALETARIQNGPRDSRHHLSHIMVWDPADYDRMSDLDAIANFQALWASKDQHYDEITYIRMGKERSKYIYPINSLHKRGVKLAFGSDWYVTSANPLLAIEVAVTRLDPDGYTTEPLLPVEAIDLQTAIRAATLGSAYGNFLNEETGSIEVGKLADLIVIDTNLFDIPVSEISEAQVMLTLFGGEVVFGSLDGVDN